MNRTILHMLRTLPEIYKSNWKDHLNKLVHAYNCTKHESTGFSPFLLLFGRPPRLPIDLIFNLSAKEESSSYPGYVNKWREGMQQAYALASKSAQKTALKGKRQNDKRMRSSVLVPGDRVLVRNLTPREGPGKIRAYWEDEIHVVASRKNADSPVYDVKPESGRGKTRTLHRNLLLPCDYLPVETPKLDHQKKQQRPISIPSTSSINNEHQSDSEAEEGALLNPNQIDELVRIQPNVDRDATTNTKVLADDEGNLSEDEDTLVTRNSTETEPCQNTGDDRQVEETAETANVEENLPNHIVRPKRNRQPPLPFGYYTPGNPALWQDPNVGMVQVGDTRTPPVPQQRMNLVTPPVPQQPMNLVTPPVPQQPMNLVTPPFPQQPMNPGTPPFLQQPMNPITPPFLQQPMNPITPPFPMCYGIPPPFGYYQVY